MSHKKNISKRKRILLLFLVLLAAAALVLLCGWFNTGPRTVYQTAEYRITYSGSMADVIRFRPVPDDSSAMQAVVVIGEQEYPLFTMSYNDQAGDYVAMAGKKEKIPFAFTMASPPDGLTEEETRIFWLAQEIVNELPASIKVR